MRYTHGHPELALEKRLVVPPYVRLARIFKTFYAHVTRMSWDALGGLVAAHFALAHEKEREAQKYQKAIASVISPVSKLNTAGLQDRAAVRGAAVIIALGHDDNDTLAAALAAGAVNRHAHIVAYFEQQAFADLLVAHCPRAEAMVSMSMEMLVRAAQDPGSSRIQQDLLSVVGGQTQFSLTLPAAARETTYGELLAQFKSRHNATLIAVARECNGAGLELNAASQCRIGPGCVVYYIAATRIRHDQLQWLSAAPSPALSAARA